MQDIIVNKCEYRFQFFFSSHFLILSLYQIARFLSRSRKRGIKNCLFLTLSKSNSKSNWLFYFIFVTNNEKKEKKNFCIGKWDIFVFQTENKKRCRHEEKRRETKEFIGNRGVFFSSNTRSIDKGKRKPNDSIKAPALY